MRLSVTKSITGTLSFCLRHAVAFYLLGLLVNLPHYLYSLLVLDGSLDLAGARPWWEENIALTVIEALLGGFVIAVMARTLQHDRRGEDWTIFPGLGETFSHLPQVCGTALIVAVVVDGGFLVAEFLERFSTFVALAGIVAVVYWAIVLSVAVPVAALDDGETFSGISYSVERSAVLTKGSRWRIIAIFCLPALPFIVVAVVAVFAAGGDFEVADIDPLWALLAGALFNAFFFALPVMVHEALVELKEGPAVPRTAAVFD